MNKFKQTKRYVLLFVITIFIFSCSENELTFDQHSLIQSESDVSIDLATTVAKNFSQDQAFLNYPDKNNLKSSLRSSKSASEKDVKEILTFKDDNSFPLLYVIQFDPVGFVIVSGSMKETPILAFSETGVFEYDSLSESSQGLKAWIEIRKNRIEELRNDSTILVEEETEEQWVYSAAPKDGGEIVSGGTVDEQVGPLLSTTWSQGCGYNDLLDVCSSGGSCGRVWTGCTATATAQVMRYWEYPNSYNWSLMPNTSGSNETSILLRDIGSAVKMDYGCDGSGAYLIDARTALVNNFGYSSNASYVDYNTNTVVEKLDEGWPIIMEGYDSSISYGHAWVCDGYRRNRYIAIHNPNTNNEYETYTFSPLYLSMNWGWGGISDAWYLYNNFTPESLDFSYNNKMIINIHP